MRLRSLSVPALGLGALMATAAPAYADRAPSPSAAAEANGAGVVAASVAADAIPAPFGRWLAFEWRSRGATAGPFSYSAAMPVALSVTDDFCEGDKFAVLLDGAVRGHTSAPVGRHCDEGDSNPEDTFLGARYSSGMFLLPTGQHEVSIRVPNSPTGFGVAFFRLDQCTASLAAPGTLTGTPQADVLCGSPGNDVLAGAAGDDRVLGGGGNDQLLGGDNVVASGTGEDAIAGGSGDDSLSGGDGRDRLFGGLGGDTSVGGPGNDGLSSDGGQDTLEGEEDSDVLVGERSSDTVSGGAGNDFLFGGPSSDTLSGGDGSDICDGGAAEDGHRLRDHPPGPLTLYQLPISSSSLVTVFQLRMVTGTPSRRSQSTFANGESCTPFGHQR